jgi:hypothetical protein
VVFIGFNIAGTKSAKGNMMIFIGSSKLVKEVLFKATVVMIISQGYGTYPLISGTYPKLKANHERKWICT